MYWIKSRNEGSTLETAKVLGVKRKSLGVVLAMSLAVLLLPLTPASAVIPYTVTYASGGADSGTVPTYPNVSGGDTLTVSSNTGSLVKAGYTFAGWNDQLNSFYTPGETYTVPASNVTFTAEWTAGPLKTLTYNAGTGGSGTAPTAQTSPIGSSVNTAANTFIKTGYSFTGWNTAIDGSGTAYAAGAPYTITGSSAQILYAQWAIDTYTITYNANGATGTVDADTFTVLNAATLDDGASLIFAGKTFLGWRTTADGTGTTVSSPYSTAGNITVYAIWSGDYTITYNNNGGSGTHAADTFVYNTPVSLYNNGTNDFTKAGFFFGGWTTLANLNVGPAITSYSTPANVTLYALWKYSVTFAADGGTGPQRRALC